MQFLKITTLFYCLGLSIFSCGGCGENKGQTAEIIPTEKENIPAKPKLKVPPFNMDSAYAFVQKQVDFGPRDMGSKGHDACRQWLIDELTVYGAKVTAQDFETTVYTGQKYPATNIIASFNPENKNRIVLAAHWDTRHIADSDLSTKDRTQAILGADDAGSGVGVLLEMARQFQISQPNIGIDIVLFDAEDYGDNITTPTTQAEADANSHTWGLGSQYWAKNIKGLLPKYGILLDMVGAKNARFTKEGLSYQVAPRLVNAIWKKAARMGYGHYFQDVHNPGRLTDDHYFVNLYSEIPMIDIINIPGKASQSTFGDHWHTHNDNMQIIDRRSLRAVGQVLLAIVYLDDVGM